MVKIESGSVWLGEATQPDNNAVMSKFLDLLAYVKEVDCPLATQLSICFLKLFPCWSSSDPCR